MLIMEHDEGQGWHDGRIIPYGPISFDPGTAGRRNPREVNDNCK